MPSMHMELATSSSDSSENDGVSIQRKLLGGANVGIAIVASLIILVRAGNIATWAAGPGLAVLISGITLGLLLMALPSNEAIRREAAENAVKHNLPVHVQEEYAKSQILATYLMVPFGWVLVIVFTFAWALLVPFLWSLIGPIHDAFPLVLFGLYLAFIGGIVLAGVPADFIGRRVYPGGRELAESMKKKSNEEASLYDGSG
ncbi:MAG: hypothetical protein ACP6IT_04030 [Candidatus Thorarchaeota archaeon]